jgi:hypothetical protein
MTASPTRTPAPAPAPRRRTDLGAASAEYAAVTAAGCGFAGILIRLFTSNFGQQLLKTILSFFLKMVGIS